MGEYVPAAVLGWVLVALVIAALSWVTPGLRDVGQPDEDGDGW